MKETYTEECEVIYQNCVYTAETHHVIADKQRRRLTRFQTIPAVIAAVSGTYIGIKDAPEWVVWLGVISAVVAAVGSVLNPLKEYYDHLNAAKNFTTLKQDVRSLRDTFSKAMTDKELETATRHIHDRYNDIVRYSPPTDNKSFEEARERVQGKIHEPDPI